jgi:hypothetical protein
MWSETADAYNTTGAATQEWTGVAHNDDYLKLSQDGGHPGRPTFAVIAGYTIQAEDGAGVYRLAGGAIAKADGAVMSSEDGLDISVLVNSNLQGTTIPVSATGVLASFSRELGQLAVGDTIYVAVNAAGNQLFDLFRNFDFTIEKQVASSTSLVMVQAVPEPSATALALLAAAGAMRRGRRRRGAENSQYAGRHADRHRTHAGVWR